MRTKLLVLGIVITLVGLLGSSFRSDSVEAQSDEAKLLIVLALDPDPTALVAPDALFQTARTVERRARALAGPDAKVWTSGETRIVVELPGRSESDLDRATDLLTSNAILELIDPQGEFLTEGTVVVTDQGGPGDGALPTAETVYTTIVSGSDISSAVSEIDQFGQPTVRFQLTDEAAARFYTYTSEHLNQPLSIVLDKVVISSPVINAPIQGDGIIAGLSEDEVNSLVLQFNTGELAVPLKVETTLVLNELQDNASATPVAVTS